MNKEKMIRTARGLDTLFKTLRRIIVIAMAAAVCVMAVLTVVHWVNPAAVIGEGFESLDLGTVTVELAPESAPTAGEVLGYAWLVIALGSVCAALIWYIFGQIRQSLAPMKEGTPFQASVSQSIRRMAWVSLALGAAQNIGRMIEVNAVIGRFDINQLLASGQIRSITANYTLDMTFVLVFFGLRLVSYIFRYGEELQQLSDETL